MAFHNPREAAHMKRLMNRRILSLALGFTLGMGTLAYGQKPAGTLPSPNATIRSSQPAKPSGGGWLPTWGKSDGTTPAKPAAAKPATFDDHDVNGEVSRARNYERVGEVVKARKIYEDLRAKYPKNPEVAYRLGVVADQQRKHGEAEKLFLIATQINPQSADYVCGLGYCYFLQGRFREAETTLTKAAQLAPKNVRIRNNLGMALGHQGKYSEALQQFSAAGSEAEAYFNLAFVYASQEKPAEAKECFKKSLRIDPTNHRARDALASFVKYETLPPHLQEADEFYDERGVQWIPYNENASAAAAKNGDVRQASAEGAVNARETTPRGTQPQMRGAPNATLRGVK